jgi:hypothetical protein
MGTGFIIAVDVNSMFTIILTFGINSLEDNFEIVWKSQNPINFVNKSDNPFEMKYNNHI